MNAIATFSLDLSCNGKCFLQKILGYYAEMYIEAALNMKQQKQFDHNFIISRQFSSVQSLSHVRLFVTP